MSATIERGPGLPPYRPRKAPVATVVDGPDSATYVLILRTHDVDGCRQWAERLYRSHTGDALALTGRQSWVRLVPWDEGDHGGDCTWIDYEPSDKRACAAIWYEPAGGAA